MSALHKPSLSRPEISHDKCSSKYESPTIKRGKASRDALYLRERKRFVCYLPTELVEKAMRRKVSDMLERLDTSGSLDDCHFHPLPPVYKGKPAQAFKHVSSWKDGDHNTHNFSVNYGIVALLVTKGLTRAQKTGFIRHSWHLSHLCGNWTCCNVEHFIVEDRPTNSSRNGCFRSLLPCPHYPPCLKERNASCYLPTTFVTRSRRVYLLSKFGLTIFSLISIAKPATRSMQLGVISS